MVPNKNFSNNVSNSLIPFDLPDYSIATSPFEQCLAFNTLLCNISTLDDSNAPPPPNPLSSNFMYLPIISPRRVRRALPKLSATKAYGSDGIPPRILREYVTELSLVISRLFWLIFKTKVCPSSCKYSLYSPFQRAVTVPTHPIIDLFPKFASYPRCSKCCKKPLLGYKSFLSDHQYGFSEARSSDDFLTYVSSIWTSFYE